MSCSCVFPDLDLCLPVGSSKSWSFSIIDPENSNTPVDITDGIFEFLVKESPTDADADAVFSLTSADGEIVITNAASGFGQIDNTVAKSELLTAGRWYYWYFRSTINGQLDSARKGKLLATVL